MKKLSNEMEEKVDKFINEECGGWETNSEAYDKYREDVVEGKIKLSPAMKDLFKTMEKIRRKK